MKKKKNFIIYLSLCAIALILGFGNAYLQNNINETVDNTSEEESNIVEDTSNKIEEDNVDIINNESNSNEEINSNIESNSNIQKKKELSNNNKYKTVVQYVTKTQDYKYGIKKIHTMKQTYNVYDNGKKELQSSIEDKSKLKYDYSGYNITAKDLIPEAKENIEENKSLILDEIKHVNAYRKDAGLQPLEYDESLTLHANVKVLDMYYGNYFSHNSRTGEAYGYLGKQLGIYPSAENIAKGYDTASAVTISFYNSEGHRANMLNSSYTKIGVGYKNGYWVQNYK